jgi:hypothetical protein
MQDDLYESKREEDDWLPPPPPPHRGSGIAECAIHEFMVICVVHLQVCVCVCVCACVCVRACVMCVSKMFMETFYV